MEDNTVYHVPIMLDEAMFYLKPENGGVFVDGTLGGGGHSSEIYKRMPPGSTLIGIDRDNEALAEASKKINSIEEKADKTFKAIKGNFFDMKSLVNGLGIEKANGILLDLGVSSHQLDTPLRGFSHRFEAKLDMRMDSDSPLSACDVVNLYDEKRLYEIIRDYGEEKFASKIANAIVRERQKAPIETTTQLVNIIKQAMPMKALKEKGHPASRTFQAIRIEVNSELAGLEAAIKNAAELLAPGGVMAVITFHSLEDRIVKNAFREMNNPCICDPHSPICTCNRKPVAQLVTRKPIVSGDEELEKNPRARSAKLRVIRKI